MSDNVNEDIKKAIKESQGESLKEKEKGIQFPPPIILKHSLDEDEKTYKGTGVK